MLREEESLDALLFQTTKLLSDASDMIERRLHGFGHNGVVTDALRTSDYYKQPIWSALKSESAAPGSPVQSHHMQALIEYGTGTVAPGEELIVPRTREDLEGLGSEIDVRARLFWAEVHSIHERQRGWTVAEHYRALMAEQPEQDQQRLGTIMSTRGHLIHGLKAKDSLDRWAYYHVHVSNRREKEFLEAIQGDGVIDLVDYGQVLLSTYEDRFREHQTELAHKRFRAVISKYRDLAVREKEYSYSSNAEIGPFQVQRFAQALEDEGSRDALVSDLVRRTAMLGPIQLANTDQIAVPTLLFEYGLDDESARTFVGLIRERHLGIADIAFLARLLTHPDEATLDEFLQSLRSVALHVGTTTDQFERFLLFICQNRSLTHPGLLSAALLMASGEKKPRWWSPNLLPGILPLLGLPVVGALGMPVAGAIAAQNIARQFVANRAPAIDMDWPAMQRALAGCDMLLRCGGELTSRFAEALQRYVVDARREAEGVRAAVEAIGQRIAVKKDKIFVGRDAIERAGLSIEHNISGRLVCLSLDCSDDLALTSVLNEVINSDIIKDILSLTVFWYIIKSKPDSENDEFIRELLRNSLSGVFDRLEIPTDQRGTLIARMATALLANEVELSEPQPVSRRQDNEPALPLPLEAPELYQGLRGPESPPQFVKRVYSESLGRGLTRAHIRKLDPGLSQAINNWSRKNEWPDDVDLPTLQEQNTRWVESVTKSDTDTLTLREARRLESVLQRRRGNSRV